MMLWILILGLALEAQGQIHCSGQKLRIETSCGETVTFPCRFSWVGSRLPSKYELVWQLKKNKKDFVVHDDDIMSPANLQQSSMFANRTSLQKGWDQNGDATLQIKDITESDQGVYTCDLLTPMPFDRKICTTITLAVNSSSKICGNDQSLNANSGQSIQLPCLLRPGCLPRTKREITWRFTASDAEREVDLPSASTAGDQGRKFVFSSNGSLTLQKLSASDAGTYCCYLQGTERCLGVHLSVSDVVAAETDPETSPARWLLFILSPLAVIMVLAAVVVVAVRQCKTHQYWMHQDHASGKTAPSKIPDNIPDCAGQERSSSLVKDIEDDDLEDVVTNDCQCSVTSTSALLPDNCKSGKCRVCSSKEPGQL